MKHLSLKTKLTLLYTVLMTAVVCVILAILFSFSSQEIMTGVGSQLEERVAKARGDIEYVNGALEIDSDFLELKDGIYLSLYNSDGDFLYGKVPFGFDNATPFKDRSIRKIQGEHAQFYMMDLVYEIPGYGVVDIRGVASMTAAEQSYLMTLRLALILLPLVVLTTALLGYFMTKRTLRPVDRIIQTVQAIQKDEDLSRRVHLGKGNDEIHRLAATFDEMLLQIENSLRREQQFTSDVAHELRTPLSTMSLLCENLTSEQTLSEAVREELLLLQQKIASLSRMVSQLLMLSRADQGRARIEQETVYLSELCLIACEEAQELAARKNITVETDIAPGLITTGDETLLIRLFMNLLNNAISYGKENGHIWVRLSQYGKEDAPIEGSVTDDGIGINEQDLPRIWERFYQADRSRTDNESSGLGLSMVAWIIKAHNGTINVTSTPGKGSSFTFILPYRK